MKKVNAETMVERLEFIVQGGRIVEGLITKLKDQNSMVDYDDFIHVVRGMREIRVTFNEIFKDLGSDFLILMNDLETANTPEPAEEPPMWEIHR
tara:strand:- start:413 stop:694 length:282 start_codon:yes stop_codon:yes gene_type:complete